MILLFSEIKLRKISKSGKEDAASQLFHVIARGESKF